MKLTQKQEAMISRYLRDAADRLGQEAPDKTRERAINSIQQRIAIELGTLNTDVAADADVVAILTRVAAASVADLNADSSGPRGTAGRPIPDDGHAKPIWLGVCAHNADRFGIPVWTLRLLMLILGVTGPVSIIIYLALYTEHYLQLPRSRRPALQYHLLVWRPLAAILIALALNKGAQYLLYFGYKSYETYLNQARPVLGDWAWLEIQGGSLFALTLVSTVPLAVLSAMPLENAWDHSLKRIVQAILALYGIVIAFGIASIIAGNILHAVNEFTKT